MSNTASKTFLLSLYFAGLAFWLWIGFMIYDLNPAKLYLVPYALGILYSVAFVVALALCQVAGSSE